MATKEEFNNQLQSLKETLTIIVNFDVEGELVRTEALGSSLNFVDARDIFETVQSLSKKLLDAPLETLDFGKISNLVSQAQTIVNTLNSIKSFDPAKNSIGDRNDYLQAVRNQYDTFWSNAREVVIYSDIQGLQNIQLAQAVQKNVKESSVAKQEIIKLLDEARVVVEKTKQAAGQTGVVQYALYFKDQADIHKKTAYGWLIAIILVSGGALMWGAYEVRNITNAIGQIQNVATPELVSTVAIQVGVTKLVILSILYFSIVWVSRNYRAHRHNYVVNQHRAIALQVFEAFVKSAEDLDTKSSVLRQATQAIFSAQSSGYLSKESDPDQPNQVIEILRHITPGSGK